MSEEGFANPAIESAHAFRPIMRAMARPGSIQPLEAALAAPAPLLASTAAIALTLCDFQTPVWLGPGLRGDKVEQYLRFNAGAPLTEDPATAQFAILAAADMRARSRMFAMGTHEYPDRSATLILQVAGFVPGAVELSGPGIPARLSFGVAGLDADFWEAMAENHGRFPVGVDVIFAAPRSVAALPRSTAIQLREAA